MAACCCRGVTLATREPIMAGTRASPPQWVAIVGCGRSSFAFRGRAEPEYPQSQPKRAHSGIHTSSYDAGSAVAPFYDRRTRWLPWLVRHRRTLRGVSVSRISSLGSGSVLGWWGAAAFSLLSFGVVHAYQSGPQRSDPGDNLRCIVDANRCRHRFAGARDDIPRCL